MTLFLIALAIPVVAGIVALLVHGAPRIGGLIAVGAGGTSLILASPLFSVGMTTLDLPLGISVQWAAPTNLLILAMWTALIMFGLLEFAQPGRSFVLPATLLGTGLAAIGVAVSPLSVAVLLVEIAALLLVFPALQGPTRQAWGSFGFLTISILSGALVLIGLWLIDSYTQSPVPDTARAAATVVAVAVGLTLALVPLQFWLSHLADSAPHQVLAWIAIIGQTAVIAILTRLLTDYQWLLTVTPLIQTLVLGGILSSLFGGLLALTTSTPRRWLAYGMVYTMGLVAVGIGLFNQAGAQGAALLLTARALALLMATAAFRAVPRTVLTWQDVRGLALSRPVAGWALALAAAALSGVPFVIGFPGTWLTFRAAFAAAPELGFLLVPGAAFMGLSMVRLIANLVRPDFDLPPGRVSPALTVLILSMAVIALLVGFFPQIVLTPIAASLSTLPFLPAR
ncbi:MAG: proton-conducting transporter membrane subunit [Anaerolineae bacterium]